MRMVKMTNNKDKSIVADFAPLGSTPCKEIAPGESVIVGPESRMYLDLYMVMVRKGFTMSIVDDNVPTVTVQPKKEPEIPVIETPETQETVTEDPVIEETSAEETPVEKPKKSSRKKSSPESDDKSGDSNE